MIIDMTVRNSRGLVTGSMIAISFGTVFVMVNSGGLPAPWPTLIRAAGALAALGLLIALFATARKAGPPEQTAAVTGKGFMDRRYRLIVAAEAAALFGGLYVINGVLKKPDVAVAWVAVVVGVHFFGLASAWRMPLFHWLGAAMTALGLIGFLVHGLGGSAAAVGLIAGVGSGVLLYASVVGALTQVRRDLAVTGR
jgi:hypothetical protein